MKKIIGIMCAVVFIFAGLCGCGSNNSDGTNDKKADKGIESVMQAGPTTMDEWKIVMLDYESYFKEGIFISQANDSDGCYITMKGVTEDEFKAFVDEAAKTYSKDMASSFRTDSEGNPMAGFYGETPDGKYTLSTNFYYSEYDECLILTMNCYMDTDDNEEETEE